MTDEEKRSPNDSQGNSKRPPPGDGAPFTDVNQLPVVAPAVAQKILQAAIDAGAAAAAQPPSTLKFVSPDLLTKPGVERWPVKTGQDPDVGEVAKNVIDGVSLGPGIVPATVEQLVQIPRPADMAPPTKEFPAYQSKRRAPLEFIVWQVQASIIFLKLEADGDYHMVLQGASGDMMIIEVPTPTTTFVGSSPWLANIKTARDEVDKKLVSTLSPNDFVPMGEFLVPRAAAPLSFAPQALPADLPKSFTTPPEGQENTAPAFKTAIKSTPARVTGVGFFDSIHGQTGVAQLNGIELHPVLKIEWL